MGAIFTFPPVPSSGQTSILARVGVSFISSAQACANAEEEIPDFNFDAVHKESRDQWNDLLGRVQVDTTGVDKETVQLFYSSVGFAVCNSSMTFTFCDSCTERISPRPIVSATDTPVQWHPKLNEIVRHR